MSNYEKCLEFDTNCWWGQKPLGICVAKRFSKYIEERNEYLGTIPRWYVGGGRVGSLLSIVDWSAVRSLWASGIVAFILTKSFIILCNKSENLKLKVTQMHAYKIRFYEFIVYSCTLEWKLSVYSEKLPSLHVKWSPKFFHGSLFLKDFILKKKMQNSNKHSKKLKLNIFLIIFLH